MIYDIYYDLSQEKRVSTAQKMKFYIKDFFSKCDQIHNCRFGHIYLKILKGILLFKKLTKFTGK